MGSPRRWQPTARWVWLQKPGRADESQRETSACRGFGRAATSRADRPPFHTQRGWRAWTALRESALRKRASMRQGMGHMLNKELSKGWRAWTGMIAARAEFLELLGREPDSRSVRIRTR